MSDTIKNALLVAIAILTLANTVILLSDDSVSYDRSNVKTNVATTPAMNNNTATPPATMDNQADVVPPQDLGPKTTIQFDAMEHDFGTIDQQTTNPTTFTFTNTGDAPLIIAGAKGSCGCTVPDYPRQPIAPGEKGEIKVVYSPNNQANQQQKTVTITANTEPATTVLKIKANVTPGTGTQDANANTGALQIGG